MASALGRVLRYLDDPVEADAIAAAVRWARQTLGVATGRRSVEDLDAERVRQAAAARAALFGPPSDPGELSGAIPLPLTQKKR